VNTFDEAEAKRPGTEDFLRNKARSRVPRLEAALKKREEDLARDPGNERAADWANLIDQYKGDLKLIAEGSYPGYNGLPFGAGPGIT
jgi:hypothetical protein